MSPRSVRRRRRLGQSSIPAGWRTAEQRNNVWELDAQFDVIVDGRTIKLLNILDEYTREAGAIVVDRWIDADATVPALEKLVIDRGAAPQSIAASPAPNSPPTPGRLLPRLGYRAALHRSRIAMAGSSRSTHGYVTKFLAVEQFDSRLDA